jgi:hypothetical protein
MDSTLRVALLVTGLSGLAAAAAAAAGCRDTSRFTSNSDRFEGPVVKGSFVRSGIAEQVTMCVTLDANRLQDAPGTITTSDGRFRATPMRPIPQIWHDPLSTLSFGDGRSQNLVYAASPAPGEAGPEDAQDVMIVISLMQSDQIEVRLVRGAPHGESDPVPAGVAAPVFGVFTLERRPGACSF